MKREDQLRYTALEMAVRVMGDNFEDASFTTQRAGRYLDFLRGSKPPRRQKKAKRG